MLARLVRVGVFVEAGRGDQFPISIYDDVVKGTIMDLNIRFRSKRVFRCLKSY